MKKTGKRINIITTVLLCLLIGAELWVFFSDREESYPDIASQLSDRNMNNSEGKLLNFENISVHGRNYSRLICRIQNGKARIISLKTEEDTLYIPSSLGQYPVKVIGGDWTELPEAVAYAKKNQETPSLGVVSWMNEGQRKYKKILIEEGVLTVYAESFYGVKAAALELPESMLLLGALSFANSEIDEVTAKNPNMYSDWGAFLNTEYQNKFRQTKPENRSDSTFSEPEDGISYLIKNK